MSNKEKIFTIDRIENNIVVLEDENRDMITIEAENIVDDFSEGDILKEINNKYYIDKEKTKSRRNKVNNLMKGLWAE